MADISPDNGILAKVPGNLTGDAIRQLPPPGSHIVGPMSVVVQHPELGPVRVTYQAQRFRHGRSGHWAWIPKRADQVGKT